MHLACICQWLFWVKIYFLKVRHLAESRVLSWENMQRSMLNILVDQVLKMKFQ